MRTTCMQFLKRPKRVSDLWELQLQAVVSCNMGVGTWTHVLCKYILCFSEPSLQPPAPKLMKIKKKKTVQWIIKSIISSFLWWCVFWSTWQVQLVLLKPIIPCSSLFCTEDYFSYFWDRVSHSPGWTQTHYVSEDVFELLIFLPE